MNRMQEGVESAASPDGVPRAPAAARRMPRPSILGVEFDFTDYAGVLAAIRLWRDAGRRESITITNPHSVLLCRRDEQMRLGTTGAGMTLPDGVGVIWAARILGYRHQGRVTGPTLMLRLCDWGREHGLRHLFFGGREGSGVITPVLGYLIDRFGFYSSFTLMGAALVAVTLVCSIWLWGSRD